MNRTIPDEFFNERSSRVAGGQYSRQKASSEAAISRKLLLHEATEVVLGPVDAVDHRRKGVAYGVLDHGIEARAREDEHRPEQVVVVVRGGTATTLALAVFKRLQERRDGRTGVGEHKVRATKLGRRWFGRFWTEWHQTD